MGPLKKVLQEILKVDEESGHILRSPTFLFNQRAGMLAGRYSLAEQDILDAYKEKPGELKDMAETMHDSRTLKNFFVPFLALVGAATCFTSGVGVLFVATALGGGYYQHRKHEGVGEALREEIRKTKAAAPAPGPEI